MSDYMNTGMMPVFEESYKLFNEDSEKYIDYICSHKNAAIVSDPPFGLPGEDIDQVIRILKKISDNGIPMILIMDWRNSHVFGNFPKIGELIWEYGWVSGGRAKAKTGFFPTHNTIHLIGEKNKFKFIGGSIIHRKPGFSSPRQCSFAKKTGHPYEKPLKLMEYLIDGLVGIDVIVDPFMGSCSTGVAAINKSKKFIGFELEEKWFNISNDRLNEIVGIEKFIK